MQLPGAVFLTDPVEAEFVAVLVPAGMKVAAQTAADIPGVQHIKICAFLPNPGLQIIQIEMLTKIIIL
jgi:hypothetical protein